MPLNAADAQILGDIINDLNPYYDTTIIGWEMDIDLATTAPAAPASKVTKVMLEVDDHYYGEWNFNGQPQKISRALRIRYRYPVSAPSGQVYWLEDYLLIGFEGADGAG
jgi:hypothetical protein